jgi:predicted nuclease of predicted toxin-antitoxin system
MRLLLDENLSRRLVPFLQNEYPGSTQVVLVGLEAATDQTLWEYAKANDYVIVTRDADFEELSLVWGQSPKVIWLKTKNQSKASTLAVLLDSRGLIEHALYVEQRACVEINLETSVGSATSAGKPRG